MLEALLLFAFLLLIPAQDAVARSHQQQHVNERRYSAVEGRQGSLEFDGAHTDWAGSQRRGNPAFSAQTATEHHRRLLLDASAEILYQRIVRSINSR